MTDNETEEAESNFFAMNLLMPESFIHDEIEKLGGKIDFERGDEIRKLARIFQVSETLMAVRLAQIYKLA